MEQFGISKLDLKRRNRMQILKQLQQQGPTSRIDLSSSLELTRAAVTIITNEMIAEDVLYEKGEAITVGKKASRGRKKILIDINENYRFVFGVVIDHKRIYIGLSNLSGQVLEKRRLDLQANDTREFALHQIFVNMKEMLINSCLEEKQVQGIGVCMNERALKFMQVKVTNNIPDYSVLEKCFQCEYSAPVIFDSIINGIACAENDFSHRYPTEANIVVIRFTDQIEAALIVNNELYRGHHNRAMDLSHMVVNNNGTPCYCDQKGCALTEFSDESIYVRIVNIFSQEKTPKLYEKMNGNPNLLRVADVHKYICLGDEGVEALFEERLENFTIFINNLVRIIDPQRIVLYGRQFEDEVFLNRIKNGIQNDLGQEACDRVVPSFLQQDNIYLSGCALAVRRFFIERGGFSQTRE